MHKVQRSGTVIFLGTLSSPFSFFLSLSLSLSSPGPGWREFLAIFDFKVPRSSPRDLNGAPATRLADSKYFICDEQARVKPVRFQPLCLPIEMRKILTFLSSIF